jgi:hypothetical protein
MELDEIKEEYYKILKKLAKENGRSIEEIDKEISDVIKNMDIEDILIKSSELL